MTKKILSVFILFLLINISILANNDPAKMALGTGFEWNMNSRDNFAAGAVLAFDYNLGNSFAAGANLTASSNFNGISVIEPVVMFRYYFLGSNHNGWFIQADTGVYLVLEDSDVTPLFLGGIRGGLRIPLGKIFIEPFGRLGYPFAFGFGCLAGIRF